VEALYATVGRYQPDVVIVDVRLPPTHTDEGLRAAVSLRRDHPGLGVLVLSEYIETRFAAALLAGQAGGVGYLLKDRVADVGKFIDALIRVADGGTALDPEVASRLLATSGHGDALATLTHGERDVVKLMADGRSNTEIAHTLAISVSAVDKHVTSVFDKLGLSPAADNDRRVRAVLRYLRRRGGPGPEGPPEMWCATRQ
jgi:DNA-binding NarL/FixJ family response regulator